MAESKYTNKYVYLITNMLSMKQYVGSRITSIGLPELDVNYLGSSKYLATDIKAFGKENFKKEILEIVDDDTTYEYLLDRESYYILKLNTLEPNGYNRFLPNQNPRFNSVGISYRDMWKVKYDPETYDRKIKELNEKQRLNGKKMVGEKNPFFGKKHLPKSIQIMREKRIGTTHSQVSKDKISKTLLEQGGPFTGKLHTEKAKEQNREKHLNKKYSDEVNAKKGNPKYGIDNGMFGKCKIYNKDLQEDKTISKIDLELWINSGWELGTTKYKMNKTCFIYNEMLKKHKVIKEDELCTWINNGWIKKRNFKKKIYDKTI